MIRIKLNGNKMKTKEATHAYLKNKLESQEYHGNNLDALWDVLSTYNQPTEIKLKHKDKLIENLGSYGESLIRVFQDAEKENDNIIFKIKEDQFNN